ncbi:MAG: hypothetical protein KatS3mg087_1769 [Patescibacteria group bacterium]|nr:MAG: hypothetical protein KatS3mg087_1769 [Patescibacteria group bacterium]
MPRTSKKFGGVSVDEDTIARINKRMVQVQLCREFGWTLEYVDSLDEAGGGRDTRYF